MTLVARRSQTADIHVASFKYGRITPSLTWPATARRVFFAADQHSRAPFFISGVVKNSNRMDLILSECNL
jgi:hypothetical protein